MDTFDPGCCVSNKGFYYVSQAGAGGVYGCWWKIVDCTLAMQEIIVFLMVEEVHRVEIFVPFSGFPPFPQIAVATCWVPWLGAAAGWFTRVPWVAARKLSWKTKKPFMQSGVHAGPILTLAVLPRDAQQCISFLQFGFQCMHLWLPIATWQKCNWVRLEGRHLFELTHSQTVIGSPRIMHFTSSRAQKSLRPPAVLCIWGYSTRLLTRFVRLPIPGSEQINVPWFLNETFQIGASGIIFLGSCHRHHHDHHQSSLWLLETVKWYDYQPLSHASWFFALSSLYGHGPGCVCRELCEKSVFVADGCEASGDLNPQLHETGFVTKLISEEWRFEIPFYLIMSCIWEPTYQKSSNSSGTHSIKFWGTQCTLCWLWEAKRADTWLQCSVASHLPECFVSLVHWGCFAFPS